MKLLSETQVRFEPNEIRQMKEFAKENGVKYEYVAMNAALVALGHDPRPPTDWNYTVEFGE